jgi:hypothetical protein
MGWTRSRGRLYYIRYRWADGRCVADYFGRGPAARLAAEADRLRKLECEAGIAAFQAEAARAGEAERKTRPFDQLCTHLARAALVARGYHLYRHGQWRRRREDPRRLSAG